jgi:hypothetical protein
MTDYIYACNSLRNDEYENDQQQNLCESAATLLEKIVKPHQGNSFLVGFSNLEPLCDVQVWT